MNGIVIIFLGALLGFLFVGIIWAMLPVHGKPYSNVPEEYYYDDNGALENIVVRGHYHNVSTLDSGYAAQIGWATGSSFRVDSIAEASKLEDKECEYCGCDNEPKARRCSWCGAPLRRK